MGAADFRVGGQDFCDAGVGQAGLREFDAHARAAAGVHRGAARGFHSHTRWLGTNGYDPYHPESGARGCLEGSVAHGVEIARSRRMPRPAERKPRPATGRVRRSPVRKNPDETPFVQRRFSASSSSRVRGQSDAEQARQAAVGENFSSGLADGRSNSFRCRRNEFAEFFLRSRGQGWP